MTATMTTYTDETNEQQENQQSANTFNFDRSFQEKILQAMVTDHGWAAQFSEVLEVDYFSHNYLKFLSKLYLGYFNKYKEFPSVELFTGIIRDELKAGSPDALFIEQIKSALKYVTSNTNLGDLGFVKDQSLSWCKKMALTKALDQSLTFAEHEDNYEKIVDVIQRAVSAGNAHTQGLDLETDIDARYSDTYRHCVPTGVTELDQRAILNGGLGAGELGVIVASAGCHAKGTDILMFNGEIAKVEDIKAGDLLMGPDSTPRKVLELVRGTDVMYEIFSCQRRKFHCKCEPYSQPKDKRQTTSRKKQRVY